ncbi:hypothetical protein Nepgr_017677 [Nepenthes gracilis]|uniref:Uncharacterized protein n=1 Tax=Nepenthes gracilis TaxID=150966 RepID=A0AAD3SSG9_NEPGR|nr:hypothetical protein Nepgr_017677 [Nepenthes gracilis]
MFVRYHSAGSRGLACNPSYPAGPGCCQGAHEATGSAAAPLSSTVGLRSPADPPAGVLFGASSAVIYAGNGLRLPKSQAPVRQCLKKSPPPKWRRRR